MSESSEILQFSNRQNHDIFNIHKLCENNNFHKTFRFPQIFRLIPCNNQAAISFKFLLFKPLSFNPTKWSNTLKQFIGKLPTNCSSVFDHFVKLVLKGLI